MMTRTMPLIAALALAGCQTLASHGEYESYRSVREADNERAQLAAMRDYVQANPEGLWRERVQGERDAREEGVWTRALGSVDGLLFYQEVYPDGRHYDEASERVAALRHGRSTIVGIGNGRDARLAERRRTWGERTLTRWLGSMASITALGAPAREFTRDNGEFLEAFTGDHRCGEGYCVRTERERYHLAVPGATRIDRELAVEIRTRHERGRVTRVELVMPERGFTRWYEMANGELMNDHDPEARRQSVAWASERLAAVLARTWPGAERIGDRAPALAPLLEEATAEPAPETPDTPNDTDADPRTELEELMHGAAPITPEDAPDAPGAASAEPEAEPVLPRTVLALRRGDLRLFVIASAEDGDGYDGIVLSR